MDQDVPALELLLLAEVVVAAWVVKIMVMMARRSMRPFEWNWSHAPTVVVASLQPAFLNMRVCVRD